MPAQFTLYTHGSGPNGTKVAAVLRALNLTYDPKYLDFNKGEQKSEEHVALNPNGRIPTLVDHQSPTDNVVWESNAILTYLVEKYDTEHKISGSSFTERTAINSWLYFQASGQGPLLGQAAWFKLFHHEKVPSAIERYEKETLRVLGVLESVLVKRDFLVGNHVTIADLSFIPWNSFAFAALVPEGTDVAAQFPKTFAWHNSMLKLPYVVATLAEKDAHAAAVAAAAK